MLVDTPRKPDFKPFLDFVKGIQLEIISKFKEEPVEKVSLDKNPPEWARVNLKFVNPWELLDDHFSRILVSPGCDLALVEIIQDAAKIEQARPELDRMARKLIDAAEDALVRYQGKLARKEKLSRGERPADIARTFVRPLRELGKLGYPCRHLAGEILLQNTMPESELLNPDWVDPYTGEIDPDALEWQNLNIHEVSPTGIRFASDAGNEDNEVETASERSSEGFNSEDQIELDEFEGSLRDAEKICARRGFEYGSKEYNLLCTLGAQNDGLDVREPLWMEMQQDIAPTKRLFALKNELGESLEGCYAIIRSYEKVSPEAARELFVISDEAKSLLRGLQEAGRHEVWEMVKQTNPDTHKVELVNKRFTRGEAPADLAAIFLSFQHERGFPEEVAAQIAIVDPDASTLQGWLDLHGDEFLSQFSQVESEDADLHYDPSPAHVPTTLEDIEEFTSKTFAELVAKNSVEGTEEITQTPEFVQAFFQVMFDARETSHRDEKGVYHNLAVEAGWDAWREKQSPKGNLAYKKAMAEGAMPKSAMKAFWAVVNLTKARPKDQIAKIFPDGLVLVSGRKITYSIAVLKLKNSEFEFPEGARARIKEALNKAGIGLKFAEML